MSPYLFEEEKEIKKLKDKCLTDFPIIYETNLHIGLDEAITIDRRLVTTVKASSHSRRTYVQYIGNNQTLYFSVFNFKYLLIKICAGFVCSAKKVRNSRNWLDKSVREDSVGEVVVSKPRSNFEKFGKSFLSTSFLSPA